VLATTIRLVHALSTSPFRWHIPRDEDQVNSLSAKHVMVLCMKATLMSQNFLHSASRVRFTLRHLGAAARHRHVFPLAKHQLQEYVYASCKLLGIHVAVSLTTLQNLGPASRDPEKFLVQTSLCIQSYKYRKQLYFCRVSSTIDRHSHSL
jgi:hypothetical protein